MWLPPETERQYFFNQEKRTTIAKNRDNQMTESTVQLYLTQNYVCIVKSEKAVL